MKGKEMHSTLQLCAGYTIYIAAYIQKWHSYLLYYCIVSYLHRVQLFNQD